VPCKASSTGLGPTSKLCSRGGTARGETAIGNAGAVGRGATRECPSGEYEDSRDARAALARPLPLAVVLMVFIVVCIFNSIRATLVICLTVPLAVIGVTAGLLLTRQPFGFMALLGAIALAGEQIKNSIVLVDEFKTQRFDLGKSTYQAIVDGSVSRLRPVMLVAVTTVLGMIPLLPDPFFSAMAVTIMFGLAFACVLTMLVVPALYAIFFRVSEPAIPQ
jgi:multidrug efflux pump subunit AcrB